MGILSFIKDAGEKLFGTAAAPAQAAQAAPAAPVDVAALNRIAGDAIANYIKVQGLNATNLQVAYDGASHTVTVSGEAPDQATKEKILVAAGNVHNVEKVDDQLTVTHPNCLLFHVFSRDLALRTEGLLIPDPPTKRMRPSPWAP